MHNVVLIENLKSINKLFEDKQGLLLWNDFIFPEDTFKSSSIAVLVDEVEIVGCF